ncbi:unnamed protein product [Arctia plantaginis]|uniref:Uncharacterized protein n=1 Tax=Arctia plantaginis TaxID=874455 RepID=A0A8S1A1R8_ARCPL|nr:unnamed protein product [Arctia plantaginis]CAB3238317.1 unnamed protein product [Arctia plantaginis]
MEQSTNNAEGRGLARRGRMRSRGARGVRTRGGQRGGGRLPGRPSVSEPVFSGMLENLPEGQALERPIRPKRMRVLPATVTINPCSETLWSSLEMITPSTSRGQNPVPMPAAPLSQHY